jgi:hypothetical protein
MRVYPSTSSRLFRRDVVWELPPWFYDTLFPDLPLVVFCAEHGRICLLDEVMSVYRVHSGGVWSGTSGVTRLEGSLKVYQQLRSYLSPRYEKPIKTSMARAYLGLAAAYADEGDIGQARRTLGSSIAELPTVGLRWPLVITALALRLYVPRLHRVLKKVWHGTLAGVFPEAG